jgi:hypothetical protein
VIFIEFIASVFSKRTFGEPKSGFFTSGKEEFAVMAILKYGLVLLIIIGVIFGIVVLGINLYTNKSKKNPETKT